MTNALPETVDGLPNISGSEDSIREAIASAAGRPVYPPDNGVDFARIRSACAIALHMHQPLIPPVGDDLRTAEIVSNLKQMRDRGNDEARGNANVFHWCYKRMGEFIPQLVDQGSQPRVMLDYSGTLLHGPAADGARRRVRHAAQHHLRSALSRQGRVAGLRPGAMLSPPRRRCRTIRLHVRAWQHHFAALFGIEALRRVRGFSPCEMALPNHPDVAYEFVSTLRECGYQWVLVQEHTVERPDGGGPERKHLPHRLVCRNSRGETAEIIAIIKTQGSDTKLVAPDAALLRGQGLSRWEMLAGRCRRW